jgi:vanillate O-demethylase monooxygenase subunit
MHALGRYTSETIDRVMGMASYLPGFHAGITEVTYPASHPEAPGQPISRNRVYHTITPSTPRTCYYHFAVAVDGTVNVEQMRTNLAPVIDEDIFASVEIEKMIDLYDGEPPAELMVKGDTNTVVGRRMIQAMMDAEQSSVA